MIRPGLVRAARATILFLMVGALLLIGVGVARAQDEDPVDIIGEPEQTVGGRLTNRVGDERLPVEGAAVVVSHEGGEIGRVSSDDDGRWVFPLDEPGEYDITIDPDSFPSGVGLVDPDRTVLTVEVNRGQDRRVQFQIGQARSVERNTAAELAERLVIGLKFGAIIALASIGLSLVFAVTGLVNFAHVEVFTVGAFVAYAVNTTGPEWPLVVALIPAILAGGLLGWSQETAIWGPLRRRGMGLLSMMVVSIGLGLAIRFIVLVQAGGLPRAYPEYAGTGTIRVGGVNIAPTHVVVTVGAVVLLVSLGLLLQRTRAGTAIRAVRDNPDLAESSGIDVKRVITVTWIISGMLAAIGGVAFGLTESLQWNMGFKTMLLMFAAIILGGIGTAYGTILGAFIVGISIEMSTIVVPTELKNAVGLVILVLVLLVRPQGLLGVRERIG